ncbi:MAG: tetratricopeptide repeat protein [Lentisphaerae bacterium]|nr:tetratricopeptide repeat protein [Lentisphaerota bacterium]
MALNREDYEEPVCLLQPPRQSGTAHNCSGQPIPLAEVIARCDELFNANDPAALGEHLRFWRQKAQAWGDKSGELSILSEMMGHYRMTGNETLALQAIKDGLQLLRELNIANSVSCGTILINAATALQAFGYFKEALTHYAEAFRCYNSHLDPNDWRFAGLLNNMAAAHAANGDFQHAQAFYRQALEVLTACGNLMDKAVTFVNLAQLYDQQDSSDERINQMLDQAMQCFQDPAAAHDGYFAHTCSKCASAFGLFGRLEDERLLKKYAGDFYAGA